MLHSYSRCCIPTQKGVAFIGMQHLFGWEIQLLRLHNMVAPLTWRKPRFLLENAVYLCVR